MAPSFTVFYGAIVTPETLTGYKSLPQCLLCVGSTGNIDWVVDDVEPNSVEEILKQKGCTNFELVKLLRGQFLIPGFIDTHTHAPQFPNIGSGQQYELLDWLEKVTFPTESKFSDVDYARRVYTNSVQTTISYGTTTCCYYGTIHLEGTKVLADIAHKAGQRAFIGKCNMNRNSPDNYREPTSAHSINATEALISYIRALPSHTSSAEPLVQPILTPRFAISCTSDLLNNLGDLAKKDPSLRIQTHISENHDEIKFTKELFPDAPHYAGVYDGFGLLKHNTILAHGVHLEDAEIELISERKAGISHCPTSNFNLTSGVAPIGKYLDRGIKVGLGTDVSGGYSPSILNAVQAASVAAKVIASQSSEEAKAKTQFTGRKLPVATLFYLATLGGAEVCNLEKNVGSLEAGKAFDALLVDARPEAGNRALWNYDLVESLDDMLERFLFCGDDRNISRVYVQGSLIGGQEVVGGKPQH